MRVSREQAAANRERIIETAGELFRSKGFSGIGVADIMKAAELTHGGFYGHFASKDDLVAQASRRSMQRSAQNWRKLVAESGGDAFATLLTRYLSPRHRDDPGQGCALRRSAVTQHAVRRRWRVHPAELSDRAPWRSSC